MSKSGKNSSLRAVGWILRGLGVLVVLVVAIGLSLPFLIDPNDYRERIAQEISQRTGYAVRIDGDLRWSLWPNLSIEVNAVEWPQPAAFSEIAAEPLARVGTLDLGVELIPLLRREVRVTRVALRDVAIELIRDTGGRENWEAGKPANLVPEPQADGSPSNSRADAINAAFADSLGRPGSGFGGSATTALPAPADAAPGSDRGLGEFSLGALAIENARVRYRDLQADTEISVTDVYLATGRVQLGEVFDLEARARMLLPDSTLASAVDLKLSSRVEIDAAGERFDWRDAELRVQPAGGAAVPWDLRADATAWLDRVAGTFALPRFELRATLDGEPLQLSLDAEGRWSGSDAPSAQGRMTLAPFSPQALSAALARFDADTENGAEASVVQLPQHATLTSPFRASGESLQLDVIDARIDETAIEGSVELAWSEIPDLRFDLHADRLDVDDYVVTPDDPRPEADRGQPMPPGSTAEPDLQSLQALTIDGRLRVDVLKVRGLRLDDVSLPIRLVGGRFEAHPFTARLYSGTMRLNLDAAFDRPEPRFGARGDLEGIEIGALLEDLGDERAPVSGIATVGGALGTEGLDPDTLLRRLDGDLRFQVADGAVRGINVAYQLRRANAALRNQPAPDEAPQETDFSSLQGTASVRSGVVDNPDLVAASPLLRVQGSGRFDLPAETLDYRAQVRVVGTLVGQSGETIDGLRGVDVPLRVSGSFDAPRFRLDLDDALRDSLRERAEDRIRDELQRRLGGRDAPADEADEDGGDSSVEDQLRRGLRDLFNR